MRRAADDYADKAAGHLVNAHTGWPRDIEPAKVNAMLAIAAAISDLADAVRGVERVDRP